MMAAGMLAAPALAEYPEQPIDVIVAFNPGGGTDVAARTIEPFIEKYLGADLVILNKPGAGGEVGFSLLAASEPDGYTLGFINLPAMFAYSYTRETAYSPESFAPVANLVYDPGIFAVRSDSQFETLGDLIEFGKANPGALPIGTSGSVGSSEHLAIQQVQAETESKFNHVPFGATAPLRTALLGGHIPVAAFNLSEATDYADEGDIRILGVMSAERAASAPDVPTFREQGVEVISGSSRGLAFPAGTPDEIVAVIAGAVAKAMEDPEYIAKAESAGAPLAYLDPAAYGEFLTNTSTALDKAWEIDPWVK
ncbi:tripartite tricarboxylate transporter substrate binding protein [Tropicimonas sp. IMCC6043]|nr:tripartite tricarboxylate transporter substrate binding protein [Tropicimonas sp. IMCC6043]